MSKSDERGRHCFKAPGRTGRVGISLADLFRLFTNEVKGNLPLAGKGFGHLPVKHSFSACVNGMAHTRGTESYWGMLKRGCHSMYHSMSKEHLHRYVDQLKVRHNERPEDKIDQVADPFLRKDGGKLVYKDLIAYESRASKDRVAA